MKEDKGFKKPFSIKEIGLPKIITAITAGIALILLSAPGLLHIGDSSGKQHGIKSNTIGDVSVSNVDSADAFTKNMERRLENTLRKVKGIGEVQVMITLKSSKEQVALKDNTSQQTSNSQTDAKGGTRTESDTSKSEETVMSQSGQGETSPYVIKELEPEVEGVLVIARGGDNAKIINEINGAVQVLFHVPAHKIKVMKMI
ncbi:hypothetical protein [[Clostridium] polysaccharolyticum]|uniref:Stage III sporulation protein AG n=1 Tax=[Clostridium] polysaccharolyticum TaxID=29364 RepID=A0A1H9ZZU8_9FIRM|nr:hypothetical protein [[Clostridium] polysaccharolyticum]SES87298.1 stage III sporulation protein AG [[Clostridium] polysaccharolyticum]